MGNKHGKRNEVDDWLKEQELKDERLFRILLLGPGDSGKSTILKQMKKIEEMHGKNDKIHPDHSDAIPLIREGILIYMHILCKSNLQLLEGNCDNKIKQDIAIKDSNVELRNYFAQTKITRFDARDFDIDDDDNKQAQNHSQLELEDNQIASLFKIFARLSQSHIKPLWDDKGIKNTIKYRSMFQDQIPDSAIYFLDKLEDISKDEYNPSFEDFVRLRTKTSGAQIVKIEIDLDKLSDHGHSSKHKGFGLYNFEFTDIGGQACERNKWAKVMNDQISVVLFVAAVSEYDLPCYEDITKRRMQDALDAFHTLMTHNLSSKGTKFVEGKQVVVLFNKFDLFADKLASVPLSSMEEFSDFKYDEKEGDIVDAAVDYFETKFVNVINEIKAQEKKNPDPKKPRLLFNCDKQLTFYNSQALNTQLIQQLFHKIMLHVVTGNLEKMGMGNSDSSLL